MASALASVRVARKEEAEARATGRFVTVAARSPVYAVSAWCFSFSLFSLILLSLILFYFRHLTIFVMGETCLINVWHYSELAQNVWDYFEKI